MLPPTWLPILVLLLPIDALPTEKVGHIIEAHRFDYVRGFAIATLTAISHWSDHWLALTVR